MTYEVLVLSLPICFAYSCCLDLFIVDVDVISKGFQLFYDELMNKRSTEINE